MEFYLKTSVGTLSFYDSWTHTGFTYGLYSKLLLACKLSVIGSIIMWQWLGEYQLVIDL